MYKTLTPLQLHSESTKCWTLELSPYVYKVVWVWSRQPSTDTLAGEQLEVKLLA